MVSISCDYYNTRGEDLHHLSVSASSFFRAQARDRDKLEWCRINEIIIVTFNYDENENEWRAKIN